MRLCAPAAQQEKDVVPASLLHAAAVVYGIPMLGALLAAAVAYSASLGDAGAAVASLLGLGAGLVVSRSRLRKAGCLQPSQARAAVIGR